MEQRVVITEIPASSVSPSTQTRLARAVEALRSVRGAEIAPPLSVDRRGDVLVFARPFVEGVTLAARLEQGPLPPRDALVIAEAVLRALGLIHRQGLVHLDVNPRSVVVHRVADTGGVAGATLLFTVAAPLSLEGLASDESTPEILEAARHLAPEQAGLIADSVDHRSDLYAVGALLFECVAGRPPFEGATLKEIFRQQLGARPLGLRKLGIAIPRAVDDLVVRSLHKNPGERYQSADAARADCEAIRAALDRGESDPAVVIGRLDTRRSLTDPTFVGRSEELAQFGAELERTRAGRGSLVFLEAESGGGKTALLDEMESRSAASGAWVLRGQGIDRARQQPFQVLEGIVRQVCDAARTDPALASRLQREVGSHAAAVSAALPAMAEVLGAAPPAGVGPEEFGEARSLEALSVWLDALGSRARPAVVAIDDCQWADELSIRLLAHWQQHAPLHHVLIVASFRTEEAQSGHPLRVLQPSTHIILPHLRPADLRELAESMAGPLPEQVLGIVLKLAEGSPFMAAAVLHGLVESGALAGANDGWRFVPRALANIESSRWAAAYLTLRLKALPDVARRVLLGGAVLGKEFDPSLAAGLAEVEGEDASAALDEARRRHIVWLDAEGARCAFVHDKLRESLLALLGETERRALHLAAATTLERVHPDRVFDVAFHFDAAGESERALPFALAAATRARAQNALEIAASQYRIAARGARALDEPTRHHIAEGLGEVEMLRGRYDDAGVELVEARALAPDDTARARIEGKLGELAFKRGEVKAASARIERGLRLLGQRVPRRSIGFLIQLLFETLVQVLHTLFPRLFVARRPIEGAERVLLAMRLYSRLAYTYWFQRGKVPCGWAHLREMNLAERYPPTLELAQAYSEHAPVCTMVPLLRRGIDYAQRSFEIRRRLGDTWGEGQSLHFYGVVLYAASRFEECIARCEEAVRALDPTGDRWEVNTARWHIALCLYRLGRLQEAAEVARRVHRDGLAIGDQQASGIGVSVWSKATFGKVPAQVIRTELAHPSEDIHTSAEVALAEAIRLLGAARPAEAAQLLESTWRNVRERGLRQEYVSPILPWLAQSLRAEAESLPLWSHRRKRAVLRRALRAARRAVHLARFYRNNLPHALRERALLEAMRGRPRRARRLLGESLEIAEQQGAMLERALTMIARGRLGDDLGWPGAEEELARGEQERRALIEPIEPAQKDAEAPPTLSLADRFTSVIDLGRRIAATLTPPSIFSAVHDSAVALLRGQQCVVLEVKELGEADPLLIPIAGDRALRYSRAMVLRALSRGRPTILGDRPGESDEELVLAGVRSALCAPIFLRAKPVACVVVTHQLLAGLFREEEVRLAEYITTIAGAALENASGFAAAEALSRSLEQRVVERTAELNAAKERAELAGSLLAASLEATADGILVVDNAGRLVRFNDQFAKLFRIPDEILASREDSRALGYVRDQIKDFDAFFARVQEIYAHPEVESFDIVEFKDGRVYERWAKPQRLGGVCVGRVWSFHDVTEQKTLERQLRQSKAELEEQFRRAQKASRMKSEFLANMSHELRTPLNSIIGFAELIHDGRVGPVSAEHREYLGDILTSANHLLSLINEVLDLSRVEAGKLRLVLERVDLPALAGEVHDVLRALASQKRMPIQIEIAPGLDDIVSDPGKLKQILYNYLSNALKFGPEGTPVLVRFRPEGADHFRLEVEDSGPGVRSEDLPSLFVAFQQLDGSASKKHAGTGLGLALTRQLVEAQGGHVGVESEWGRGSVFFAVLPRVSRADESMPPASKEQAHAA